MRVEAAFRQVNRLFLDSAPVIYYVDLNLDYLAIMDVVFDFIESEKVRAVTSPVTLAECLVLPMRQNNRLKQQQLIDIITSPETAEFVVTTSEIALGFQSLW
jgi:hypothetical protein